MAMGESENEKQWRRSGTIHIRHGLYNIILLRKDGDTSTIIGIATLKS